MYANAQSSFDNAPTMPLQITALHNRLGQVSGTEIGFNSVWTVLCSL